MSVRLSVRLSHAGIVPILRGGMSHWQKAFDFAADPDHEQHQTEMSPLRDSGNCKNFARSAALAEICSLRLTVVHPSIHSFTAKLACCISRPVGRVRRSRRVLFVVHSRCFFALIQRKDSKIQQQS